MAESDQEYFRRRIAEETSAAGLSSCDRIKGVHEEMAGRYSERLESILNAPATPVRSNVLTLNRPAGAAPASSSTASKSSTRPPDAA